MPSSAAESPREAVARRARSEPEQPFLFFRSPRGAITWWSFRRADAAFSAPAAPADAPPEPGELAAAIGSASAADTEFARELALAVQGGGDNEDREIWLSTRPLDRPEERLLAAAGALAGWAIVREPLDGPPAPLVLWARPTLLSGDEGELLALFAALQAEAPRWRRERWLARRLARLRTVLVERGGARATVEEALDRLLDRTERESLAPRVLPFPATGW